MATIAMPSAIHHDDVIHASLPVKSATGTNKESRRQHRVTTTCDESHYPRAQSPLVTILQKRRDGSIPKGAIYMLGMMSYEESRNRRNDASHGQIQHKTNNVSNKSSELKMPPSKHDPSLVEMQQLKGESFVASQRRQFEQLLASVAATSTSLNNTTCGSSTTNTTISTSSNTSTSSPDGRFARFSTATSPVSGLAVSREQQQPLRIEDYEPGHCSLADNTGIESRFYNPPIDKPGQHCRYVDSQLDSNCWRLRKLGPMSPTQSEVSVHELYRRIQRGEQIPEQGLQMSPADTRKGWSLPSSFQSQNTHLQSLIPVGTMSPRTRQQRDLENTMRHMRLERVVAEEKMKRLAEQQRENVARRHCDYFTPLQKSPVSLTRYDDEAEAAASTSAYRQSLHHKSSSNVRGKARALYTFRAQSSRELSFRKGDYLYLLRQVDRNWFLGERHGLVGIFPCTYVEVIVSLDEAQGLAAEREGLGRVEYDFIAQTSMELTIRKGEMVKLIRQVDENWYEGRSGGKRGIFPVSYIDTVVEPDIAVMTPCTSRTCTPAPGALSPCGSTVSHSVAPTIPSAPMSPVDSELFDDGFNRISCTSTPLPPYHQFNTTSSRVQPDIDSVSGWKTSFANDIKNITSSYQFNRETGNTGHAYNGNIVGSATWSPQSTTVDELPTTTLKTTTSNSYTQLRYPPYRVQYSYQPRNTDELELRTGDIVYVVEKCEDGWFVGTCERTQEFGTFPGNYVQRMR